MSPRTGLILLAGVFALLSGPLSACGEPPQPLPTSPPYAAPGSVPPSAVVSPPLPTQQQPLPGSTTAYPGLPGATLPGLPNPAYPTLPQVTITPTDPSVKSPTPTPSHAATCTGQPTGADILALIKGKQGVPTDPLRVADGPRCSGVWSISVVEVTGENPDQEEPLMVVATGKGDTLTFIAAGQDVCLNRVQQQAPPGIRVLACGF